MEVHSLCSELPLGKVKAIGKCFDETGTRYSRTQPMDLFQCLDVDGLAFGFLCGFGVRKVSIGIHGHGDSTECRQDIGGSPRDLC